MIYFETDYVVLKWDETLDSAIVTWRKFATSEQFRLAMDKLIDLLVLRQGRQVLADTRQHGVIGLADQNWVNQDWYPRALKTSYRRVAFVLPHNIIARMALNRVRQTTPEGVEEAYFETLGEAVAWLSYKTQ